MAAASDEVADLRRTTGVLKAFDGDHSCVAKGVARGEYAFWLGSGISRCVAPGVPDLLRKVLAFLRQRVEPGNPDCEHRSALVEIFGIAGLTKDDIDGIDVEKLVDAWPGINAIVDRLGDKYSAVLDVSVDGHPEPDYLIWEAIDVHGTYGDWSLEPDAEHLCVAILMLEGVVPVAATANWDGLVEAAVRRLQGSTDAVLRVVVDPCDFRAPQARSDLVKFHGCAVRAAQRPEDSRHLLVGRLSQIGAWMENTEYALTRDFLVQLVATRRSLVIGLSAQDQNIHGVLAKANVQLAWKWPDERSAVAFALEKLTQQQTNVLKIIYANGQYEGNRKDIDAAALLGTYAKPLLAGLVLFVLSDKLSALLETLRNEPWGASEVADLQTGVRSLRDLVAATPGTDCAGFVTRLVAAVSLLLSVFRTGKPPANGSRRYEALTVQPILASGADPNIDTEALRNLAVAASLLGHGTLDGRWNLEIGDAASPQDGVCTLTSIDTGRSKVFLVQDEQILSRLAGGGYANLEDPDVLAIHARENMPRQQRSPASEYGRSGRSAAREVAIETIVRETSSVAELFERFRYEAAI